MKLLVLVLVLFACNILAFPISDRGKDKIVHLKKVADEPTRFTINLDFNPELNYRIDIKHFDVGKLVFKDIYYDYNQEENEDKSIPAENTGMKQFTFAMKSERYETCPGPTVVRFVRYLEIGKDEINEKIRIVFVCDDDDGESVTSEL